VKYTKVQVHLFGDSPFMEASAAATGVWLRLAVWCADRENGGLIASCRAWPDRLWIQATGFGAADVAGAVEEGLATWEGDGLRVVGYDLHGEEAHRSRREGGARGGSKVRHKEPSKEPPKDPSEVPSSSLGNGFSMPRKVNGAQLQHAAEPSTITSTSTSTRTSTPLPPNGGSEIPSGKAARSRTGGLPPSQADAFASWWAAVPRRVSKGQAERAWASLLRAGLLPPLPQLLESTRRWAKSVAGSDPHFVKHPATWLNAHGWADELPGSPLTAAPVNAAPGIDYSDEIEACRRTMSNWTETPARRERAHSRLTEINKRLGLPAPEPLEHTPAPGKVPGGHPGPTTGLDLSRAGVGGHLHRERGRA